MKKIVIMILTLLLVGVGWIYYKEEVASKPKKSKKIKEKSTEAIKLEELDIKNSIFKNSYQQAINTVEEMSIEEKVGQLFLVRYDKSLPSSINEYYPGGYILFSKDFENHTKESMKEELSIVQKDSKYPLVLGVDEEGGFVTRVSRYPAFRSERFKSPKTYYKEGGFELLEKMENEKATLLKDIGINLNLAPVADVSTNSDDFIYNRAFGEDASQTATYIEKMVKYANNNHISSCLKHFPGYGNNIDTHTEVAIDNRNLESFEENDFLPFKAGIKEKVPMILVSHNIVNTIDSDYPSSLSNKVINILRDNLSFTGIIVTDDLAMDAVKKYVENGNAATLAINAGNDMIITSDFKVMYDELLQSLKEGKITEKTINKAVTRIMAWKYEMIYRKE